MLTNSIIFVKIILEFTTTKTTNIYVFYGSILKWMSFLHLDDFWGESLITITLHKQK